MSGRPYLAAEDSALLRGTLARYSGERFLEIGAGNGGNLIEASRSFRLCVGTDLVRPSMSDWASHADFVLADGASCFRDGLFDLAAFNPPYLREDQSSDLATEGGMDLHVPIWFLREALRVVRSSGKVVMLFNGGADLDEIKEACSKKGFGLEQLEELHLFYEDLYVYEAAPIAD